MKDILSKLVQAVGNQATALQSVAEQVTALKQTLALHNPEIADDLKSEIRVEQEKSRADIYELQVDLARLKEAIAGLPD